MPCILFVLPLQVTALFRRAERQLKQLMAESAGLTQAEATVRARIIPRAVVETVSALTSALMYVQRAVFLQQWWTFPLQLE